MISVEVSRRKINIFEQIFDFLTKFFTKKSNLKKIPIIETKRFPFLIFEQNDDKINFSALIFLTKLRYFIGGPNLIFEPNFY